LPISPNELVMPSSAQAAERERLLAAIESNVTNLTVLGELRAEVDGADLDEDDRAGLLGRIAQYVIDNHRWADQESGESFDDAA
jgi:hypothetical protein